MAKTKTTFNLNKLAGKADKLIAKTLNSVGVAVNRTIQENLENGIDLNDKSFEPLKPSTQKARERGWGHYKKTGTGTQPLLWQGTANSRKALRETRLKKAKKGNLKYTITMVNKHGAFHNTGGDNFPPRKWFGIPKNSKKHVKTAMETLKLDIVRNWKK